MEWTSDSTRGHWLRPLLDPSWSDMHLVAGVELHGGELILDAAGWRYLEPRQGNLDPRVLAGVATHLADHTTTPDVGIAAVWEGWGGQPTVVAAAPRLVLPDRAHYLFAAGVREFTDPSWTAGAPWVDDRWPNSPSILWPDDHTWVLVSEVDFDSTVVAGSRALIDALVADPTIEAHEIPEGARLDSASDTLNH